MTRASARFFTRGILLMAPLVMSLSATTAILSAGAAPPGPGAATKSVDAAGSWSCQSPAAVAKSAAQLERTLETWAKEQGSDKLSQFDFDESKMGRKISLFAAQLLPKETSFLKLYRECWVHFVDLTTAVEDRRIVEAQKDYELWHACATASFVPFPKEALEFANCWLTASKPRR